MSEVTRRSFLAAMSAVAAAPLSIGLLVAEPTMPLQRRMYSRRVQWQMGDLEVEYAK